MLLKPSLSLAPYPGLRPFEAEESDIFFGREKQTDELLDKLQRNRFLAVIGPSGCGKSSLVRAGLIAAVETGYMAEAGSRWRVARMRPGDRPLRRLAESLLTPSLLGARSEQPDAALFLEAALRRGPLGLLEVAVESDLCRDANLLVLVDQFEEVFRFRAQGDPDEADAFVAMLLTTAAQSTLPIYVIITMRSDFLGDCSLFRDLPEAINRSAYLIPRLTREQCASAITGPARVCGGDVEPRLVNRLLNEFGPDPDQLPVLQHALMRMWFRRTEAAPDSVNRTLLSDADYEALGGLSRALSDHADEVMRELTPAQGQLAKIVFQRLTERGIGKRDTRAPARMSELASVAGVDVAEIVPVIEAFRRSGRNFLTPPEGPLIRDTLVDIGHESLIRQWRQLAEWVEEAAESVTVYARLRETALLWPDQAGLWGNPDLENAVEWRNRVHPNPAWASRYGNPADFARAMAFLEASESEHRSREAQLQRARERELRRVRHVAVALAGVILAIVGGLIGYWYGWVRDYPRHYNEFVKVHGVPRGLGALTAEQRAHRPVSLKIVKAGRFGLVVRMEATDSRGELTPRHSVGTYFSDTVDVMQRREVRWEYLYDDQQRITSEVAYDRDGRRVWAFVYSPTQGQTERIRLAHFVGADGYPRQAPSYGGAFVRIEYGDDGYEESFTYRNAIDDPRAGLDQAFGRRFTHDVAGNIETMVSLGPDGEPMIDNVGNAGLSFKYDAWGNKTEHMATDASGRVTTVKDGWSRVRVKYDTNGNRTELTYFDEHDRPTVHKTGHHRETVSLDQHGNVTEYWFWDTDGKPTFAGGCHGRRFVYDEPGNPIRETCVGPDGKVAADERGVAVAEFRYDNRYNMLEERYLDAAGQAGFSEDGYSRATSQYDDRGNSLEIAYFGVDGQPVATKQGFARIVNEYDGRDNETSRAYFGTNGKPIVIANIEDEGGTESVRNLSYARIERRFDENGRSIYQGYFDENGNAMRGPDGYAAWRTVYDSAGNRIELSYVDLSGERVLSRNGYAGWRSEFDAFGRETRSENFGVRGEPIADSDGIAAWTLKYDTQGNETERVSLGLDGNAVMNPNGYAGVRTQYDRRGEAIEFVYLGPSAQPTLRPWNPSRPEDGGYARHTLQYDTRNRVLEHAFFGLNGESVGRPEGWARMVNRYDLRGTEPVQSDFFDANGAPATIISGFHSVRRQFDVYGRLRETTYYDQRGAKIRNSEGFATMTQQRDRHGRLLLESYFAEDGSPLLLQGTGIHKSTNTYDERGQLIEKRFFGVRNEPVRLAGVFQHLTRNSYDQRGRLIEVAHFDVAEKPAIGYGPSDLKCMRWTGAYDGDGKLLSSNCETDTRRRRR